MTRYRLNVMVNITGKPQEAVDKIVTAAMASGVDVLAVTAYPDQRPHASFVKPAPVDAAAESHG